jgi:uncharacterized protein (DUF2235 family)
MKRLAICCDGTWNTPDQTDGGVPAPTNVVKLYNAVTGSDAGGTEQLRYYHSGVGTDPGWFDKLTGGSLGVGLDRNIMSAYRYICDHYEPGDEIYLFGFSRGAYTVRSLAGLIGSCGVLVTTGLPDAEMWKRVQRLFKEGYREGGEQARKAARAAWAAQGWKFHAPAVGGQKPIHFLGVWDTVGALGIPDNMALLNLLDDVRAHSFHDTELGGSIKTARHAVAIDEMRATFQPTLWTNAKDHPDVKQIWFPGVHSDVGGGYKETGLADGALKWMLDEAGNCGLAFDPKLVAQVRPHHQDVLHNSLSGVFSILQTQPRCAPCFLNPPDAFHSSAIERYRDPPITQAPYRPTQLLQKRGDKLSFDVFALQPWNDTGLYMEAGVNYRLAADGEWMDSSITCGPAGTDDGKFQLGETAQLVGSAMGVAEEWFKKLTGNKSADFWLTKRHEKMPWFCLVGAVANGQGVGAKGETGLHETVKIGTGCPWTPKMSGYLYAYANDAWRFYDNNRGKVRLTMERLS